MTYQSVKPCDGKPKEFEELTDMQFEAALETARDLLRYLAAQNFCEASGRPSFSSQVNITDEPENSNHDQIYRNDIVQ